MKTSNLFTLIVVLVTTAAHAQDPVLHTINIDFGNGPAYVGDDGVLSSPGGTYWNTVSLDFNDRISSFPDPLLDEFGNQLDFSRYYGLVNLGAEHLPQVYSAPTSFVTGIGQGPLADGVQLPRQGSITLTDLSNEAPITVVVYFTRPVGDGDKINTVATLPGGYYFSEYDDGEFPPHSSASVTGAFPGVDGQDYVVFNGVPSARTTLGRPESPGVRVAVPDFPGVDYDFANIAAIQIRGHWAVSPEPASAMLLAGASMFMLPRRPSRGR